eukprot:CAMPEP_0194306998 /NCGR_PEP_ID=MMETSP0171-20130528/3917_1 /TAXON_ID=218684 /ORGANISM="Corethron pennatum, Strain L29A3" /LENGTH=264 /DNA_ID=CAMNT_0039058867 /DNA_START=19 /DNA_END=813 /DNA_ORIENTATION=+
MKRFELQLVTIAVTATVFISICTPIRSFTTYPIVRELRTTSFGTRKPVERIEEYLEPTTSLSRRIFVSQVAGSGVILFLPRDAVAGIDVSSLSNVPLDGDATGAATRLKQLQAQGLSSPKTLQSGVIYTEIRSGKYGSFFVKRGSTVCAEMSIRCKSFATADEPGGLKYFSTEQDTDSNELTWQIGSGDFPKGLEEGMMGMQLNAARRITVPSQQVIAARNIGQLPRAKNEDGKRIYDNLFKTDATLTFDVFLTAIDQGGNRLI